uniref:Uncharacterized protein n=1 Tax=mine drainage metagenome TaxID=410659 RepID=E6QM64_9ZZZZ
MGWFGGSGVTGGAAGDGQTLEVERDHQRFAFEVIEPEVACVGGAESGSSVDADKRNTSEKTSFEAVAEGGETWDGAVVERAHGQFGGLAESDDGGDVFCSGAATAFVAATDEEGFKRSSATDVERADALGGVHLVSADGEQVTADPGDIDGQLSGGLNGVDVEVDAVFLSDLADGLDGLDDAGFIVGEHNADKAGVGQEGGANGLGIDKSAGQGRDARDLDAASGKALGGGEDGGVFDGGGDEVVAGTEQAEERGVVALGAAGVEDDFCGMAAQELSEYLACVIDGAAGGLAGLMDRGGVAEVVDPEGAHGLDHLGQQRGGGVGIHVDSAHWLGSCVYCIWSSIWGRRTRKSGSEQEWLAAGLRMIDVWLFAVGYGDVGRGVGWSDVFGAGADEAIVVELFDDVGGPACDAAHREDGGEEIDIDAERGVGGGGVEIDVCVEVLFGVDVQLDLPGPVKPFGDARVFGELLAHATEMGGARVFGLVDAVSEAGDFFLVGEHLFDVLDGVSASLVDGEEHTHDGFVCPAVERAFEGADCAGDGGVNVRERGGDDASGEGGGIQLVVGVEDEGDVEGSGGGL